MSRQRHVHRWMNGYTVWYIYAMECYLEIKRTTEALCFII